MTRWGLFVNLYLSCFSVGYIRGLLTEPAVCAMSEPGGWGRFVWRRSRIVTTGRKTLLQSQVKLHSSSSRASLISKSGGTRYKGHNEKKERKNDVYEFISLL